MYQDSMSKLVKRLADELGAESVHTFQDYPTSNYYVAYIIQTRQYLLPIKPCLLIKTDSIVDELVGQARSLLMFTEKGGAPIWC